MTGTWAFECGFLALTALSFLLVAWRLRWLDPELIDELEQASRRRAPAPPAPRWKELPPAPARLALPPGRPDADAGESQATSR
jgi:hypothetical protein